MDRRTKYFGKQIDGKREFCVRCDVLDNVTSTRPNFKPTGYRFKCEKPILIKKWKNDIDYPPEALHRYIPIEASIDDWGSPYSRRNPLQNPSPYASIGM